VNQKIQRKLAAVRLLEQAVRLLQSQIARTSGLNDPSDRSIADLCRYSAKLRDLAKHDPDSRFWEVFQRAYLKLLKHLLRFRDWPIR